ncbi:MAG: hypothetical protein E7Z89_06510 [Cyanobacteria bacterium SIG28]|nr:hypothetical protein [Cyanobacteria bacterium SIG28]
MSTITGIDNSVYAGLIESSYPRTMLPVEPYAADDGNADGGAYYSSSSDVDLNNYYKDLEASGDLFNEVGQNVVQSLQALDQAMVNGLQNGMSVQDVCNIKLAKAAYGASCFVMKSTFELMI